MEETEPSYGAFIQGEGGVLKSWLSMGASGWRLDVADELPDSFIRGVRSSIKETDPDALLLGEVWDDCATKFGPEGRRGYVNGDELDGAMNYPLREALIDFLNERIDAYACADALNRLLENYPKPFYDACLNLLGSHDTERIRTALTGIPDARTLTREQQLSHHPDAATLERAKRRVLCGTALLMALPGVPCIYYGDEVGMTGMCDPLNRGTFPWGNGDTAFTEQMHACIAMRRESEAFQTGGVRIAAVGKRTLAVIRDTERETRILLVNSDDNPVRAILYPALFCEGPDAEKPLAFAGAYRTETGGTVEARASMSVMVPGTGVVLLKKG